MSWTPPAPPPSAPPPRSSNPEAVAESERIHAIDVVRGAALAGVLLANLLFAFRVPASRGYLPPDPAAPFAERLAEGLVQVAIQGKAITLFSFLFGVGLAIQHERFARLGNPRYWLARRLVVLLLVGVAHLTLVWNGDILTEYALAGLLVLPFLEAPPRTLLRWGIALYAFYLVAPVLPFMPPWPEDSLLRIEHADALRIYGTGSWGEIRRYSLHEWHVFSPVYLSLFTVTPALFLFGVATWRSGVLREPAAHREWLRWVARAGLVFGLGLSLVSFASGTGDTATWAGFLASTFGPAVLAAGYGATLVLAVEDHRAPRTLRALAAAGRMAFTNYLMQSLVFTTIFYAGHGFGLIGKVGAMAALLGGIAFFSFQVAFSRWWLARFRFGPLEWAWRSLTYGRMQPFRR